MSKEILLDTCALIWLATGSNELSSALNNPPVATGDKLFGKYGIKVIG